MSRLYIPKVIGHRGAKAYAPENTLSSFHAAADLGIEWVELDVKLTKDGEAVVFHDEELSRCTSGSGLIAETTFADLREMDAGSWFGESFMNERVPTLEEALDAIHSRGMGVNIEIKPCPGRETETAEVTLDVASRLWPDDAPKPLISSFSHVSLETALDMIPEWPRGFLMDEHTNNWREAFDYLKAETIHIDGRKRSRDEIEEYIETQKPILAYTINNPELARQLLRWGVDGFFSDCPDVIREAVETRH